MNTRTALGAIGLGLLIAAVVPAARSHRGQHSDPGAFDYYVLSLSWAPDFCATAGSIGTANECGSGRHVGFVVHGLWPQANTGRGPEDCGPSSPVAQAIVNLMLPYIPTSGLIQHEWSTHGTCSGLSPSDYFSAVRKARNSVQIPPQFTSLTQSTSETTSEIEGEFAASNPNFPQAAFHATCSTGMLQEARICFDKNLAPQACTASAGECTAGNMTILPPR